MKTAFEQLQQTVKKMRDAQKQYFKTRDREDLRISKAAEREVDLLLDSLNNNQETLL